MLPRYAVHALRDHRRRQLEERLASGTEWRDHDLIFTNRNGAPIDPMTLHRDFRRLLTKAGLARIHFHVLRHSAAALMLAQGVPFKTI